MAFASSSAAISCPVNTVIDISALGDISKQPVFDFGMIGSNADVANYCAESALPAEFSCSSYINSQSFREYIAANCDGKDSCEVGNLSQFLYDMTYAPQ